MNDQPGFAALPRECLLAVFGNLHATDLARCMAVNHHLRLLLQQEDDLWRERCRVDYGVTNRSGPDERPQPSFHATCAQWQPVWRRYGALAPRALRAWQRIGHWTAQHLPVVALSLRPGATEEELDAAEVELGLELPDALRVIYRIHNGQQLQYEMVRDSDEDSVENSDGDNLLPQVSSASKFHGLFGGYQVYDHAVTSHMLPLHDMVNVDTASGDRLLFARDIFFDAKLVYCDPHTASVEISGGQMAGRGHLAVPLDPGECRDGVLRWFEAYAEALDAGAFEVQPMQEGDPTSCGISLFPRLPPVQVEAVTRGIRIRASPIFLPELSDIRGEGEPTEYTFAYSIRMALLPEVEQQQDAVGHGQPAARPFTRVQLLCRHWIIRNAAGEVVDEVHGPGVIGRYPVLTAGGEEFFYQSCTRQVESSGSLEGELMFVEDTIGARRGQDVHVAVVPRMNFTVPDIFF